MSAEAECASVGQAWRSLPRMLVLAVPTDAALEAERLVRDASQFKWYAVTLLAVVFLAYANEVERGRPDIVAAGLAVWVADWFNEILNSVIFHVTDRAPLWATTGPTAYQILIGLNVEISFMFALAGLVYVKFLPEERDRRILGMPNRLAVALGLSLISVAVEIFLSRTGTFHWDYPWWNVASFPVIVVFGYLWFFLFAAWVYDAPTQALRWRRVGGLAAIDVLLVAVFGLALGWL
ncbi:MAG: hypothetical protein DYH08_10160 [Actinobacteria bacterium ATB1]|nr:hypothetical protein [Actinobacteria bacterium ATB1]